MSFAAKLVLFIAIAPILVGFVWALFRQSSVTIPHNQIGVLVKAGRPTDRVLLPGVHWVPALRRRSAVAYPSVELSYRAGDPLSPATTSEAAGPPLVAVLGDRAEAELGFTVRFRIDQIRLAAVHDRFGPDGIWPAVRDSSAQAVKAALSDPSVTVDSLFGGARTELEARIGSAVRAVLDSNALILTAFSLGKVDLGQAGDLIQAVVRARLELERENAETETRIARARHDSELAPYAGRIGEAALRYRQTDVWRDLLVRSEGVSIAVPGAPGATLGAREGTVELPPETSDGTRTDTSGPSER
jgi:regulator of protease activity HflC (stomatin/prohibitin superfamily)